MAQTRWVPCVSSLNNNLHLAPSLSSTEYNKQHAHKNHAHGTVVVSLSYIPYIPVLQRRLLYHTGIAITAAAAAPDAAILAIIIVPQCVCATYTRAASCDSRRRRLHTC